MPIRGKLTFAGDKSLSHRALMLAALAEGESTIRNLSVGQDVESTRRCLAACGIELHKNGNTVVVTGGKLQSPSQPLDCGNSGTSVRLLMGLLAGQGIYAEFTGDASLNSRPMNRIITPLTQMGARLEANDGKLPVQLKSAALKGIEYTLPMASAQVKSAVLLAGLGASGTTTVIEPVATRDHTELMLANLGADLHKSGDRITVSRLTKSLNNFNITLPGDPSTAAFFAAAAAGIPGSHLRLENVLLNERRIGFFRVLEKMGGGVKYIEKEMVLGERVGNIEVEYRSLKGAIVIPREVPGMIDELPLLAVLATQAEGRTEVHGATELRVKESDRIKAINVNLTRMGVRFEEFSDGFAVAGQAELQAAEIKTYGDHRIAMAFTIAGLFGGPVQLDDPGCAAISAPEFFNQLKSVVV